jgi:peroxiredoxin
MRAIALLAALSLGCGASGPDPGASGGAVGRLDPPAGAGAMAPNLAPAPGGAIATWLEPSPAGHRLRFSRLRGGAWSPPVTVSEGRAIVANWADVPSAAEAAGGVVVAHWAETREKAGYDVVLARSTDGGATWARLGRAHDDGTATEHGFVTLVPEGERVRAVWLDGRETLSDSGAMTLRTALVGARIEAGELLDRSVCDCCNTAGARTNRGLLLAYRDRSDQEMRDISVLTRGESAKAWSGPRTVHADGWRIAGCPVNGPAVAADGQVAAVAWYTYAGKQHSLRAAFSRDGGASFAPAIEVDGAVGRRTPLGRVGLVLDRGEALVSWLAAEGDRAEILIRRVAPDGRLGPERRIARTSADRKSGVPRMVAVGEQLLVAWTELPGPRLRATLLPARAIAPVGDLAARALPRASEAVGPVAGEPAPSYRAESLDREPASLEKLRGKVVLLNVWATWCIPCRKELVDLATLHRQRASDGLTVVAASVDERGARDKVAEFVRQHQLPFAVWLDPDDRASRLFGVRGLPATFLIGRDGVIRWRRDGVVRLDDPELARALAAALAERSSQGSGP